MHMAGADQDVFGFIRRTQANMIPNAFVQTVINGQSMGGGNLSAGGFLSRVLHTISPGLIMTHGYWPSL
jgi:hypothetical protein